MVGIIPQEFSPEASLRHLPMPRPVRIAASLTNRVFLACTLLVALALTPAFGYLYWRISSDAETDLSRDLAASSILLLEHQASMTDTFARMTRLVADLPKLKAAVATNDPPTVAPLAEEYRRQISADVLVIVGRDGGSLASAGAAVPKLPAAMREASAGEHTTFWRFDGGLLEMTSVPILLEGDPPDLLGRLTAGFLLDAARAEQFKRLTRSEVAFLAGGETIATTLPGLDLAIAARGRPPDVPLRVVRGREEFTALLRPLVLASGTAAAVSPVAVVLHSRTERLQLLSDIRRGLVAALLGSLVLATLFSYAVARSTTKPLRTLTAAMRTIAETGDLTRKVPIVTGDWDDEDARLLASSFNRLTESVATFQREEAQRERLSSLGRLSTVIAHEVRNPLMIIKTALRSLRRQEASGPERLEAIADIDEETTRLNRIVSDVLDFARPVSFHHHSVDLNALCRTSVDAAWADTTDRRVLLELDATLPCVSTDGERLRTALVNILTNARQAVGDERDTQEAGVDVVIRTGLDAQGTHVTILDHGRGIAPEVLAHIFDPYFTTRRTGTGLGLPIAKNIIEGLGGRITVTSARGRGTELRITLPSTPAESLA